MTDTPGGNEPNGDIEVDNPTKTKLEEKQLTAEQQLVADGQTMAVLCYVMWPIPYVMGRDNSFVVFHLRQGALLLAGFVAIVLVRIIGGFFPTGVLRTSALCMVGVVAVALMVFAVIGAMNAYKGLSTPLPLIGPLGDKVPIKAG